MHRSGITAIVISLITLCGASSRPVRAQVDAVGKAPGWVIILASDYKGAEDAVRYEQVQANAIRAYRTFNMAWGVPADHIVLLASGGLIDEFCRKGTVPNYIDNSGVDYKAVVGAGPRVEALLGSGDANDGDRFRRFFADTPDDPGHPVIPFYGAPTAMNFGAAKGVFSRLATHGQTITFVVTAYVEAASQSAGATGALRMMLSKDDPTEQLTEQDFRLADCAAEQRVLLFGGLSDADTPPDLHVLKNQMAQGGVGVMETVVADCAPSQEINKKFSFLKFALLALKPEYHDDDLAKLCRNPTSGIDHYMSVERAEESAQSEPILMQTAPDASLASILHLAQVPEKSLGLTAVDVEATTTTDPCGHELVGVVKIRNHSVLRVPAAGGFGPQQRADRIKESILSIMGSVTAGKQVTVGIKPQPNGEYTVEVGGTKIVTADNAAAHIAHLDTHHLAVNEMASIKGAAGMRLHMGVDSGGSEQYLDCLFMLNKVDKDSPRDKEKDLEYAAQSFERLIADCPGYPRAILALTGIYIRQNKSEKAAGVFARLTLLRAKHLAQLDTTEEAKYRELEKSLKP